MSDWIGCHPCHPFQLQFGWHRSLNHIPTRALLRTSGVPILNKRCNMSIERPISWSAKQEKVHQLCSQFLPYALAKKANIGRLHVPLLSLPLALCTLCHEVSAKVWWKKLSRLLGIYRFVQKKVEPKTFADQYVSSVQFTTLTVLPMSSDNFILSTCQPQTKTLLTCHC